MTSMFTSLTEQDSEKIAEDRNSQNTKRSTKVAKEMLANYESNNVPLICILLHEII